MLERYPDGVIYVLPLGDFTEESSPSIEQLIRYANIFLGCNVKQLASVQLVVEDEEVYWMDQCKESGPGSKEHLSSRYCTCIILLL